MAVMPSAAERCSSAMKDVMLRPRAAGSGEARLIR
jgi:hypothetical protein